MYVVGLDVSWLKTPFLRHKLLVSAKTQIDAIRQCGAKLVTIDPEQGVEPVVNDEAEATVPTPAQRQVKKTSLADEMASAQRLKKSTKTALFNTMQLIQNDRPIDVAPLGKAVDLTIESLMKNNRALATLFHMKSRGLALINHCFNMMSLALLVGQQIQYSDEELRMLGLAALLADIGWVKLPVELFTLRTAYTDEEFGLATAHVEHSLGLLRKAGFDEDTQRIVEEHHEHFDGSGYPHNLQGENIHPMARILSMVDHFDSAIYGYYDSGPVIPPTALSAIYKKSQTHAHDPTLIKLLVQLVGIYPISSAVVLNTGERGIVTKVNWRKPLLPTVRLFYNRQKQALARPFELDLALHAEGGVERTIKQVIDPLRPGEDPAKLLRFEEED